MNPSPSPLSPPRPARRLPIFWRVYLHGVVLLVLILLAVAGLTRVHQRLSPFTQYADEFSAGLVARGEQAWTDPVALQRELKREYDRVGVEITVRKLGGHLIASGVTPPLAALSENQEERLHEGRVHVRQPKLRFNLSIPLPDAAHPTAYATITVPIALPVAERLGFTLFAILAVIALGSIPLARAIARPLERLTRTAQALGAGDLSVRSGIRQRDEVGVLAAAFDEMAERLQRQVKSEKELLANVSHELRTPLARIGVALDLAQEGDGEKVRTYLGEIRSDLAELEALVGDILTAAKLTAGGSAGAAIPPLRRDALPGQQLIDSAAQRFTDRHPDRKLEVSVTGALPVLDADPVLLRRALDNLLENAAKYSDPGQPVRLRASPLPDATGLQGSIEDQGIGIEPEDLPRLFTPFFRTDRSRARGTGGVGLGLLLAKQILEAHGGTLALESEPGKGTTVRFRVPANESGGNPSGNGPAR